jgi:hypothetical protein
MKSIDRNNGKITIHENSGMVGGGEGVGDIDGLGVEVGAVGVSVGFGAAVIDG